MQSEHDSPSRRALRAVGTFTDRAGRIAGHLALLLADAERDARVVARDSQALWALLGARAAELAGVVRATPRLARVVAEVVRQVAAYRVRLARAAVAGVAPGDDHARATARRVRELCVELRGGVLKLGQLASSRPDLLPPAAIAELAQLQDRVPPLPDEVIRAHVAAELGRPLDEVFARFGPPLAAASLAQVHEATLLDGTEVAVKVLVPGIEAVVEADLHALRVVTAAVPELDLGPVAAELTRAVRAELDCRAEAAELEAFAARFAGDSRIVVPRPHRALTTRRVLVMDRLYGARLTDFLDGAAPEARDPIVTTLVDCFAEQILEHGVFHADPHPGNFLVVDGPTGPRLALLDFGCVTRLPNEARRAYAGLVLAIFAGDAARAAALFAVLGFATRSGDPAALHELAALILEALREGADLTALDPADQLTRALALLTANPLARVPQHFVLIGRVLASLGGIVFRYPPRAGLFTALAPRLMRAA